MEKGRIKKERTLIMKIEVLFRSLFLVLVGFVLIIKAYQENHQQTNTKGEISVEASVQDDQQHSNFMLSENNLASCSPAFIFEIIVPTRRSH